MGYDGIMPMHFVIIVKTCGRKSAGVEKLLSVHAWVFRLKMLFLDLDLDRDWFSGSFASYFAL